MHLVSYELYAHSSISKCSYNEARLGYVGSVLYLRVWVGLRIVCCNCIVSQCIERISQIHFMALAIQVLLSGQTYCTDVKNSLSFVGPPGEFNSDGDWHDFSGYENFFHPEGLQFNFSSQPHHWKIWLITCALSCRTFVRSFWHLAYGELYVMQCTNCLWNTYRIVLILCNRLVVDHGGNNTAAQKKKSRKCRSIY